MKLCSFLKKHVAGKLNDGRYVFHTLRWCGSLHREYWFTMVPSAIIGEQNGDMSGQFDARDIPKDHRVGEYPREWVINAMNNGWAPASGETLLGDDCAVSRGSLP